MSPKQRALLDQLQSYFPLTVSPYTEVARRLGMTTTQLRQEIIRLKRTGVIRRIGAVWDAAAMGYHTVLLAAAVPPRLVTQVARRLNRRPAVTHNYVRSGPYNVWFTLHAGTKKQLNALIRQIRGYPGIEKLLVLPAQKVYKINAVFPLQPRQAVL